MPKRCQRASLGQRDRALESQLFERFWVLGKVSACRKAFQIINPIVKWVAVDVVDVMTRRDRSVNILPDVPVQ